MVEEAEEDAREYRWHKTGKTRPVCDFNKRQARVSRSCMEAHGMQVTCFIIDNVCHTLYGPSVALNQLCVLHPQQVFDLGFVASIYLL